MNVGNRGPNLLIEPDSARYHEHVAGNMETFLFTSESVNEGHPDKLCDQVWGRLSFVISIFAPDMFGALAGYLVLPRCCKLSPISFPLLFHHAD